MIVVVGRLDAADVRSLAGAVAARGGRCEIVGTVAPDAGGDRVLGGYASLGVGHAAVLRTAAPELEAADLELALRYLPDARVIVLVGADALAGVAAAAASWAGASLVRVTHGGETRSGAGVGPDPVAGGGLILEAPARDPDAAFAGLVADLALRLDGGEALAAAWVATLDRLGAEPVAAAEARPRAGAADPRPGSARAAARPGSGRRSGRR